MIPLNDKWGIKFTELAVEVHVGRVNQKTKELYYIPQYYYQNLSQAIEGIIDRSLDVDITSLEMLNDRINQLKADVKAFLKKNGSFTGDSQCDL